MKLILYSQRVVQGSGLMPGAIYIENGKILDVLQGTEFPADVEVEDVGNAVVMPGLIDAHVHINEPGRTEWEGFETATKAAAAGGVTTLVDMPLNSSPVTTTPEAVVAKKQAGTGKLYVNCGLWGGVVPANAHLMKPLLEAGVLGIKAFLSHSGIDEFPNVTRQDLEKAMPEIAAAGLPLLAHAELVSPQEDDWSDPTSYQTWLNSRPSSWETAAFHLLRDLCEQTGCRTHIVHLACKDHLSEIVAAQMAGLPLTVETCPHYLCFDAAHIPDGDTRYKCAPPIRTIDHQDALWQAIEDGVIDFIVTDHSPASPDIKELSTGNLQKAWGGIASLGLALQVVWPKASAKGFTVLDMARLMSTNVANFIGLGHRKGQLKTGYDADLVVWDPDATYTITTKDLHFRHPVSPYLGQPAQGKILQTWVNGTKVYDNGDFVSLPLGQFI